MQSLAKGMYAVCFGSLLLLNSVAVSAPTPEQAAARGLRNIKNRAKGTITGEGHCWHLAYNMDQYVEQYRKTKDVAWLDAGVQYYDALVNVMHTCPDGYKGWVGPYIYARDSKYYCAAHCTDAILLHLMLTFSELVLNGGDTTLKAKYAEKARSYVALAEKDLFEKYDARGTWHEDGPYGAYNVPDLFLDPDDMSQFKKMQLGNVGLSLPFNKQVDMGVAALSLYRITGKQAYRDRAQKIFATFKSRLCLFDDQYVWNYWEPFGEWDRATSDPENQNSWRHWIATHPYRNYQAGEIACIVDAYHTGVVFDKTDIQRFCQTNRRMNNTDGKREGPKWLNSNYEVTKAAMGKPILPKAPGGHFPNLAGCLWKPLAAFDAELATIAGVTEKPDWTREYPESPETIFTRPFHSSKYLVMVAVMPSVVRNGHASMVASKSRISGAIQIELFDASGSKKVSDIFTGETTGGLDGREGILIRDWNPTNLAAGSYIVRWTVKDGDYREFPISVVGASSQE